MILLVLTGAPGAGKGTQADKLVDALGFHKISTGDALRRQIKLGTEVGKKASSFMSKGELVPDEVLLGILRAELDEAPSEKVLLDGYPRNLSQAQTLESLSDSFPVKAALHLDVEKSLLVSRICGRRVCSNCGSSFHLTFSPPKEDGKCDRCGGSLTQRPDDNEKKVQVRLQVYEKETKPVLDFYRRADKYIRIDGNGSAGEVYDRLANTINSL